MNSQQIEDRASEALKYLTDSDREAADLKYEAEAAEHVYEATVDAHFLVLDGTVEQRKAQARGAAADAYLAFLAAQREYDAVANKRKSEALVVDWCRSIYSNYKQGK